MDRDIIKEKLKVEIERFKIYFSAMVILTSTAVSLLLKVTLDLREISLFVVNMIVLLITMFLAM